jgi:hypothetical protein
MTSAALQEVLILPGGDDRKKRAFLRDGAKQFVSILLLDFAAQIEPRG